MNKNTAILNGVIITPYQLLEGKAVIIKNGKIFAIEDEVNINNLKDFEIIDARDKYVVPGFIDIHVHGGGGADAMDGSYEAIKKIASAHSRYGTTAFLPTTMTMERDKIIKSLSSIKEAFKKGTGYAKVIGINLEGPYINPEKKGAQNEEDIKNPDIDEFLEFNRTSGDLIRLVTIAPEMPGAIDFIKCLHKHKIIASIGHSSANFGQVLKAINAGLNHVTHTFNAMSGLHHREPGVAGAALYAEELVVELIADGIHVHPVVMKILTLAKEKDKIILITDAMRATGVPEGTYELGGQVVDVNKGKATLKDGTLAGSVLTMDKAVRKMVKTVGISLMDAVQMATSNPARCLGIDDRKGCLVSGNDADIVILNKELEVQLTMVEGTTIYRSNLL
jgi:N-acetylglucosamine-6-phosphate deacetylase